ncbi:MarR family transcriptional regulator [Saccharomonospora sp. CUA-673]|uniref:MarR family winged helix-turn-helix transcriptional regulator n=1 Tax=Saccharomonospora sp. CUA-673 TaxID=1904969 RepID=UPI0009637533|nr:MarR family transcriptional regulator [Saccharomonospora sp. CUA-673]OLT47997.1 MarR family transcriptional regulator [Saccharomonospora sp. CUA-673]
MATPNDIPHRLFLTIGRLSRALRQAGAPGPGHGAISAMATLATHGELRLGDLALKEGVAAATMSRIVATLVEAGYVTRQPDPVDRRAWLAAITDEGQRILGDVRSVRIRELCTRIERLPDDQRNALEAALPALEALLDDE